MAIVIGAFTHVFWEGFTHATRFATQTLPFLTEIRIAQQPLYKLLQWGCSALGMALLAFWLYKQCQPARREWSGVYLWPKLCCWLIIVVASVIVGAQAAFVRSGKLILYYGIVAFLQTFLLLWFLLCLALLWMSKTPHTEALLQRLLQEQEEESKR